MRTKAIAAAVLLTMMAGTAAAAEKGGYLGASYGRASFDNDDFDGSDDGYKIAAGGYAGIIGGEVGYVNFGNLGGNSDGPDAKAWTLAVTAGIPLGEIARVYGKVGYAFAEVDGQSVTEEIDDDKDNLFYGAGVTFPIASNFALKAEYERYEVGNSDLDMASAGLEFRF